MNNGAAVLVKGLGDQEVVDILHFSAKPQRHQKLEAALQGFFLSSVGIKKGFDCCVAQDTDSLHGAMGGIQSRIEIKST